VVHPSPRCFPQRLVHKKHSRVAPVCEPTPLPQTNRQGVSAGGRGTVVDAWQSGRTSQTVARQGVWAPSVQGRIHSVSAKSAPIARHNKNTQPPAPTPYRFASHSAKVLPLRASLSSKGAGFQYASPSSLPKRTMVSYTVFRPTSSA